MKNLKRAFSVLLSVALVSSVLLTGCGKDSKEATATTTAGTGNQQTTAAASTAEELKPVTLKWYMYNPTQKAAEPVYEAANKIIKEKINATVDFQPLDPGVMQEKMNVIIASGEEYDICFTSNWVNTYLDNVSKKAFIELGGLLDQYASGLKKDIPEIVWKGVKVNGGIYGIPNMQIMVTYQGIAFNKVLADKYQMDLSKITKYEELEPLFEIIKKNEPKVAPIAQYLAAGTFSKDNYYTRMVSSLFFVDKNLKVWPYETPVPEFKARKDLDLSWIKKGYLLDINSQKNWQAFAKDGKVFSWFTTIKPGGEAEMSAQYGFDVATVPLDVPFIDTGACTASMNAISVNSKNPERAMMLLNLVNTDKDVYNTLAFGVDGTNYKKLSDNRIELIADSGYTGTNWAYGNVFNSYLLPNQADDVWEQTKKLNESAMEIPGLGFSFNSETVKAELAAVKAIRDQYKNIEFATDMDYWAKWNEMNAKYKEAGMDKIAAELQKQLDEFKAIK